VSNERRRAQRFGYGFAVELSVEGRPTTLGVARDASQKGMLVAARDAPPVGSEVRVVFRLPNPWPVDHAIEGVVVRVSPLEDPSKRFEHEIAIEYDRPEPALEAGLQVLLAATTFGNDKG
jgi:hypothetical protein